MRLAAEKIPVLITGTDPNVALSLGGAPTSRPIRVEVEQCHHERADKILKQDHLRAQHFPPWICRRCHEQNEPTFDVCWSCNKINDKATASREEYLLTGESEIQVHSQQDAAEQLAQTQSGLKINSTQEQEFLVSTNRQRLPPEQSPTGENEESQAESLSRCAKSAVVGLLLFPPVLSFYSIYLLLKLDPTVYRNTDTRFRVWTIWILNAAVVIFGTILWWLLYYRESGG